LLRSFVPKVKRKRRERNTDKSENVVKVAAHHRTLAGALPAVLSAAAENIQRQQRQAQAISVYRERSCDILHVRRSITLGQVSLLLLLLH
jgi:hypothetical protein